jgi:ribonuclease HII
VKYLIGIDEAGRGPLAGPVSVGAVMLAHDFALAEGMRDSKKMTEKGREAAYERLIELKSEGVLDFAVAFSDNTIIDTEGIVPAIRAALARCLEQLKADASDCEIRLDGSLTAPAHFVHQTTIIRGDDLEPVISMASIAAKVERDRYMIEISKKYPAYGFEGHKGYGTAAHCAAITREGLSDLHRRSFCMNLTSREVVSR